MDKLGDILIEAVCEYCGHHLEFETGNDPNYEMKPGDTLTLRVVWDHICTMPPPLISSRIRNSE